MTTVSIPTSVRLLTDEEMEQAYDDHMRANPVPTLEQARTAASYFADGERAIFQPMVDLVAGREVDAQHLYDVALLACGIAGHEVRVWAEQFIKENA